MTVTIQDAPFDFGALATGFAAARTDAGAVVTFTGIVRADDGMTEMVIEHYPGMTERALEKIAAEATERFNLADTLIVHRYGRMVPGEMIMMVATAARHRGDAFQGAEFLMDYLKSRAPFWKKEFGSDGAEWVAAKDEDEDALSRW